MKFQENLRNEIKRLVRKYYASSQKALHKSLETSLFESFLGTLSFKKKKKLHSQAVTSESQETQDAFLWVLRVSGLEGTGRRALP